MVKRGGKKYYLAPFIILVAIVGVVVGGTILGKIGSIRSENKVGFVGAEVCLTYCHYQADSCFEMNQQLTPSVQKCMLYANIAYGEEMRLCQSLYLKGHYVDELPSDVLALLKDCERDAEANLEANAHDCESLYHTCYPQFRACVDNCPPPEGIDPAYYHAYPPDWDPDDSDFVLPPPSGEPPGSLVLCGNGVVEVDNDEQCEQHSDCPGYGAELTGQPGIVCSRCRCTISSVGPTSTDSSGSTGTPSSG